MTMPIYEYACEACGEELEARQKFTDDALTTCPECGEERLQRLVSNSSFALKGSGWYADGYAESKAKEKKDPAKKTPEPKSDTKSESKPAKKESTAKAD